jgi:prepilin-type N-terminal cleavage/methylation domain-containing protein
MKRSDTSGFSLVELCITLVVLGLIFAFSIPTFSNLTKSHQVKGVASNVAGELRLAREKAIATSVTQPIHIQSATVYHVHYASGTIGASWTLPTGITFTSPTVNSWYRMQSDGRCDSSGSIVVQDTRGFMDTVSIQRSGLVLAR